MADREILEVDVLIVGAGPAGLAAAIRLGRRAKEAGKTLSIMLIEKAREIGAHGVSGAVVDDRSLRELFPTYEADGCPIEGRVTENQLWYLTESDALSAPFVPPALDDTGDPILSLAQVVRWMAGAAEKSGVDLFPGFPGVSLLVERLRGPALPVDDPGQERALQVNGLMRLSHARELMVSTSLRG